MRRVTRFVLAVTGVVAVGLFGSAAPGVLAAPSVLGAPGVPAAPAPGTTEAAVAGQAATPGKPVCNVTDPQYGRYNRLIELSGLATTTTGYVAVNDSTEVDNRERVFFLDKACTVLREVRYQRDPYDPEDLAVGKDNTVWVADIGDNDKQRPNIALWRVPANGTGPAILFRMRYPEGKFDAEALLLDANDQPIIVTKGPGVCNIYTLNGPLDANSVVPLKKVGEFKPQRTGTSTPGGFIGQTQVTGGANSPDRKKVVLRTYSDAYEWDVPDGDVVKAITTGEPRITPLPDEPQGEAITYSADGATFLTVSEMADQPGDAPPRILQYTPATEIKQTPAAAPAPKRNALSWYERLSLTEATSLIAGVGVVGVLLVVAGVVGILQARRSRTATGRAKRDGRAESAGAGSGLGDDEASRPHANDNAGGHVYYGGTGHASQADGADERWRRGPGYAGTDYSAGQPGAGQPGAGQPGTGYDPHGYGPPAGYPPPADR